MNPNYKTTKKKVDEESRSVRTSRCSSLASSEERVEEVCRNAAWKISAVSGRNIFSEGL